MRSKNEPLVLPRPLRLPLPVTFKRLGCGRNSDDNVETRECEVELNLLAFSVDEVTLSERIDGPVDIVPNWPRYASVDSSLELEIELYKGELPLTKSRTGKPS